MKCDVSRTQKLHSCKKILVSFKITSRRALTVRQGCVLSPPLFNLYSEAVFRENLDSINACIKIIINKLRYADDTQVIASKATALELVVEHSACFDLQMNIAETKLIKF